MDSAGFEAQPFVGADGLMGRRSAQVWDISSATRSDDGGNLCRTTWSVQQHPLSAARTLNVRIRCGAGMRAPDSYHEQLFIRMLILFRDAYFS